jgi:hypothetical protein
MQDFVNEIFKASPDALLVVAGLVLVLLSVIGTIQGKIQLEGHWRIAGLCLGLVFMIGGLILHYLNHVQGQTNSTSATPAPGVSVKPGACQAGYVWREAFPGDHVCVLPETRRQAADDNRSASSRVNPKGPYGPQSCIEGFVWRQARFDDHVCVTPDTRQQTLNDNAKAESRIL